LKDSEGKKPVKALVQSKLTFNPLPKPSAPAAPLPSPAAPPSTPKAPAKPKPAAKPKLADKDFLPLAPEKRVRSDDPPPVIEQFRASASIGKKAFRVDDDDDDEPGHIVHDAPGAESIDAVAQVQPVFPSPSNLPPLPAADSAYDSVATHPWYPELEDFLPCVVNTSFPMLPLAERVQVFFSFFFFLFFSFLVFVPYCVFNDCF
jgi:hypothetical protein